MKNLLVILLCISALPVFSQVDAGCITIDFETFPNTIATDGMSVSDQYKEIFGLTLSLEGGGSPVLAERGGVQTAFQSDFGADEPAPGQDVGDFFLTDDGEVIFGAPGIPVILEFESPIDSFAGCILDLDFVEFFVITAFDEFDNIVLSDTLSAGDPGTGDGLSTCWGFNLDGCEGSVYKITYVGQRNDSGGFGLALDNFSFCYSGLNIDDILTPATCNTPGEISIFSTTEDVYEFSIDGINFSTNGVFGGLEAGIYEIYVKDENGCISPPIEYPIFSDDPIVTDILFANTTCGEDNGILEILAEPDNGNTFSLDGVNFQDSNVFQNLPSGEYTIVVEDQDGCVAFGETTIGPSSAPSITSSIDVDDTCDSFEGSITLEAQGGEGILTYSMNNMAFQESPFFENLTGGTYDFVVVDELGCEGFGSVTLENTSEVIIEMVNFSNAICGEDNGIITIATSGGDGDLMFSIDGGLSFQDNPLFEDLPSGIYEIFVVDESDCNASDVVELESPPQSFIDNLEVVNTSCDDNNGTINVFVSPNNGVEYSIDGTNFQVENTFTDLSPDEYTIYIVDENGCTDDMSETILPSVEPEIENLEIQIEECQQSNGAITVIGSGGTGTLEYSIDGISFNLGNLFDGLTEGDYTVYVVDEMGCMTEELVSVGGTPIIQAGFVEVTTPDCWENTGIITLNPSGGTGDIMVSLDGGPFQSAAIFENLTPGDYEITLLDDLGCEKRQSVSVPIPPCPIYIPNVFTPNGDANNDIFQIFTNPRYEAAVLQYYIYDRWGELVYKGENFSIHTKDKIWWDGYFNDGRAEVGMYTYLIEILHPTGIAEIFAGDVTLLR